MLWQLANLCHLEQLLVSPVAFVCSYPCSVHHHVSVLFSSLQVKAYMQHRVKAERNAMSPCTLRLQAQASILTNVHACVHVNVVLAVPT